MKPMRQKLLDEVAWERGIYVLTLRDQRQENKYFSKAALNLLKYNFQLDWDEPVEFLEAGDFPIENINGQLEFEAWLKATMPDLQEGVPYYLLARRRAKLTRKPFKVGRWRKLRLFKRRRETLICLANFEIISGVPYFSLRQARRWYVPLLGKRPFYWLQLYFAATRRAGRIRIAGPGRARFRRIRFRNQKKLSVRRRG
jgi:hypothetical protein